MLFDPLRYVMDFVIVSDVFFSSPPFEAALHSWKHCLGLALPNAENQVVDGNVVLNDIYSSQHGVLESELHQATHIEV